MASLSRMTDSRPCTHAGTLAPARVLARRHLGRARAESNKGAYKASVTRFAADSIVQLARTGAGQDEPAGQHCPYGAGEGQPRAGHRGLGRRSAAAERQ